MKRRDFLRETALAGAALSMGPLAGDGTFAQSVKSKVIIANDPLCYANNAINKTRVQDMVDHCIMSLTGQTDKAAAYAALFPKAVTAATKILIKNNESSGGNSLSRKAVQDALTSGLTSNLGIPASNIKEYGNWGSATSGPQFNIGSNTYRICDAVVNCDYFINLPVCWAVGSNTCGITLSLKNMMGAVNGSLGSMHPYFTNATTPALSILNSQPMFKAKQVLVLMDAISINWVSGPSSAPSGFAYSLIASRGYDMVAADYQGLLILKGKGLTSDRESVARTVFANAAKSTYGLGTNDPNAMDVVPIAPPWTTEVVCNGEKRERLGLQVHIDEHSGGRRIVFTLKNRPAGDVNLSLFTANGMQIWSHNSLSWNGETFSGKKAGPGTYFYSVKAGPESLTGKIILHP